MDNKNPTNPNQDQGGLGGDDQTGGTPASDPGAADPNAGQDVPEAPVTETPQPVPGQDEPGMGGDQGQNPAGGTPVV